MFASPWQSNTYLQPAAWQNASALAYFALVALGLVSFLLRREALRGWRFLVWLSFGLLAAWQMRAIPFFAVVAGPLTALNLQDFMAGRRGSSPRRSLVGRLALLLGVLGLIFRAWPGWLQGAGRRDREKHFFDHRYPLFPRAAWEFEVVYQALNGDRAGEEENGAQAAWRQILRDHNVGVVVLFDPDMSRLLATKQRLADDPQHWVLLDEAGRALFFGWKEARPSGP
jgi:hypothetical protein